MRPLPLKEKEFRLALQRTERRAIIPIKWLIGVVSPALWLLLARASPELRPRAPESAVLILFVVYMVFNLFETYAFYVRGVSLHHVRTLALVSYLVDVVYVTMLIFFEITRFFPGQSIQSNFYILYFLLVLRGFALFATFLETALVNGLISLLFVLTLYVQQANLTFVREPEFVAQLVLIWVVVLMAWFIMVVLNQQKLDLIRATDHLGRSENLARVGELAAGVAHEINNPLGIINATAEYLKKTLPEGSPLAEDVEAIRRESDRCREIVQQMLTYAHPKPSDVTVIDAAGLNDEVLQFVFPKGRTARLEVVKEYEPHLPMMKADPNLLKQALLNLYLNAKQAIPEDRAGRIVSRIYNGRRPADLTIEIQDDGVGVDPDDMEHVFDPFFTRKPKGTGLGLSVTQRIVESFGGAIYLEPAKPRGTVVRLRFPAVKA